MASRPHRRTAEIAMCKFTPYEVTAINLALALASKHMTTADGQRYLLKLQRRVAQQVQRDTAYDGHKHIPPELKGEFK